MASMDTWNIMETSSSKKSTSYSPRNPNKSFVQRGLKVDVKFEHFVQKVIENKSFGFIKDPIKLVDVLSSCGKLRGDRLKFEIPYAGQMFACTALFDSLCPEIGPDFEFADKTFFQDPEIATLEKYVPNLVNWDYTDPDSLLKVLAEFVSCYRQFQVDKLGLVHDRLRVHYVNLREKAEIPDEDIELSLIPDVNDPTEAHFMIRIALDFSKLTGKYSLLNNETVVLHVAFHSPNWTRAVPQLLLSPKLLKVFGIAYKIPQFIVGKHLGSYVIDLKKRINDKMISIMKDYEEKKEFIIALLHQQGKCVIEYDSDDFNFITIMLDHEDFHYLIHFNLMDNYPVNPPKVTLQSIYHMVKNEPLTQNVTNFPYSTIENSYLRPTRIIAFITLKILEKFKTRCVQFNQL